MTSDVNVVGRVHCTESR